MYRSLVSSRVFKLDGDKYVSIDDEHDIIYSTSGLVPLDDVYCAVIDDFYKCFKNSNIYCRAYDDYVEIFFTEYKHKSTDLTNNPNFCHDTATTVQSTYQSSSNSYMQVNVYYINHHIYLFDDYIAITSKLNWDHRYKNIKYEQFTSASDIVKLFEEI